MEENKDSLKVKELAFVVPDDVKFDKDIVELTDFQLQRWHDLMHVFYEKLLQGAGQYSNEFKWSFNKVILKHNQLVNEMFKRQIHHYGPINNLDTIELPKPSKTITEEEDSVKEPVSKNLSKDKKINLSFEPPTKVVKREKE